jgi:hypothetical protein
MTQKWESFCMIFPIVIITHSHKVDTLQNVIGMLLLKLALGAVKRESAVLSYQFPPVSLSRMWNCYRRTESISLERLYENRCALLSSINITFRIASKPLASNLTTLKWDNCNIVQEGCLLSNSLIDKLCLSYPGCIRQLLIDCTLILYYIYIEDFWLAILLSYLMAFLCTRSAAAVPLYNINLHFAKIFLFHLLWSLLQSRPQWAPLRAQEWHHCPQWRRRIWNSS